MEFGIDVKKIHFIGIGGISMSSLAAISKKRGYEVTGSDSAASPLTEKLTALYGIPVGIPQKEENLGQVDLVVFTAAISDDNPELKLARERGIPTVTRSAFLGQLMKEYPVRLGVSGTHGKSSTTGMLAHIFMDAGMDPTIACGAEIPSVSSAYRLGAGEHFIYEACEYKDSFLDFYPSVALWLNMELDHVDYFKSIEQMRDSYVSSAKDAGAVVVNWDDENCRIAGQRLKGVWLVKTGKERSDVDYSAKNVTFEKGCASFDLYNESAFLCRIELKVPGLHHVSNALCAAASAHICGISPEQIAKGLSSFGGIARRFEFKGEKNGVRVFDDYAHHPTEIEATLTAARQVLSGKGRLFCVFQPHTYSRTKGFFEEFVSALSLADVLYLAPIYAAREQNTYGVSSEDLSQRIKGSRVLADFSEMAKALEKELKPGDVLLTMGAGQAYKCADLYLLEEKKDKI
jgi:UDP-N-acetylmuramate--alanine ligase